MCKNATVAHIRKGLIDAIIYSGLIHREWIHEKKTGKKYR